MSETMATVGAVARRAVQAGDWRTVQACAAQLLTRGEEAAEGHFLIGLVAKAARRPQQAAESFARALEIEPERYDAAVELADQHVTARRNGDAAALLARYESRLQNSPRYLDLAGTIYTNIGLAERAWPLYRRANDLQPGIPLFEANLAACSVYVGRIEEARALYVKLLERTPSHQRNHYYLSRLGRARDGAHVEQMKSVLAASQLPPARNIFLYYALGKELEDLEQWDEAFHYYKLAGDAATSVSNYDPATDLLLVDRIIEVCDDSWLAASPTTKRPAPGEKTPIFIVGLPRTGTTLTERILSSHSNVESIGETEFLQMVVRQVSGVASVETMTAGMVTAAAGQDIDRIAEGYLDAVRYRLGDAQFFIEKLPFNFLYLGFIAKAFPHARLLHVRRHPMDACFAMYKQVFTWAYKFSYDLELLGKYYVAHERLLRHWRTVLGDRLVEVEYEALVRDQEGQTRRLLEQLQLEFEPACLEFDRNTAASATASSVQVREKIHTRSVQRWRHFERQLEPLRRILEDAGVVVD